MWNIRRTALAVLAGVTLAGSATLAQASDRAVFAGCVKERTESAPTKASC